MGACCCKESGKSGDAVEDVASVAFAVSIVGTRGLQLPDSFPGADRFLSCSVASGGKEHHRTAGKKDALDPLWGEEAEIDLGAYTPGEKLEFTVWEGADSESSTIVAQAELEGSQFEEQGFNGEVELKESGKHIEAYLRVKVKMPGQHFPADPAQEFTVSLENPKKKDLGLKLNLDDGIAAVVTKVSKGIVQKYNKDADVSSQVKPGDYIVKANDVEGNSKEIAGELQSKTNLELLVRRPEEVRVMLSMEAKGKELGLEFAKPAKAARKEPKSAPGNFLLLANVGEGPVTEWNAANSGQEVKPGDRIVAVNGQRGTAKALSGKLKQSAKFHVTVMRQPGGGSSAEGGEVPGEEEAGGP